MTLGIALLLEALAERFSTSLAALMELQASRWRRSLGSFLRHVRQGRLLLSLVVLFLLFLLARRIVHSLFGLPARDPEQSLRAAALGIPVYRRLIAVYMLAVFYAGFRRAVDRDTALACSTCRVRALADLMLVLVMGGTGYLYAD